MQEQVLISQLAQHVEKDVTVCGWLYNLRSKGKIHFVQIRDGSGIVQGVMVKGELPDEVFSLTESLPQESSVIVKGSVRADSRAPGGFELGLKDLKLVHRAEPYPISLKEHGTGFLMENRHLWLRSKKQVSVLRIRDTVVKAMRDFLEQRHFLCIDSPIFTPAACEGTSTLFEVDYFGEPAYLSQSGQLYAEAAAMALGRVYCFGPTFRAEKSKTRRHLTEFWMLEPEMAYAELDDVMELAESMLAFVVARVLERRAEDLKTLERDISKLQSVKVPFPRISYDEAAAILKDRPVAEGEKAFQYGDDFGAPDETFISSKYDRPVMVHRYPQQVKAFYMKRDPKDTSKALCVDVLAPEGYGEIVGGSQREDDYETLLKRIEEHKLPRAAFEWYLDLRRYGSVPHGGFGIGLERTVAWICGVEHLRECIPFPRMLYKIYP